MDCNNNGGCELHIFCSCFVVLFSLLYILFDETVDISRRRKEQIAHNFIIERENPNFYKLTKHT